MIMKTAMGIATRNRAASGDESPLGARLRAKCDQAGVWVALTGSDIRSRSAGRRVNTAFFGGLYPCCQS
jgi:hypothetical protein